MSGVDELLASVRKLPPDTRRGAVEAIANGVAICLEEAVAMADIWADVCRHLGAEATEEARLRRLLKREPVTVGDMRLDGDGVSMPVDHWAAMAVAESFAKSLDTSENYMTLQFTHEKQGRIEVRVQRVGKLTPHDARVNAEAEVRRLRGLLAQHGVSDDGPETFAPDEPPPLTFAEQNGHPEWLTIDATRRPNVLVCGRCGEEQAMPTPCPADTAVAAMNKFSGRHGGCLEVDADRLEMKVR